MSEPPGYKEKAAEYDRRIKAAEEERKEASKDTPKVSANKQIPPEQGSRKRIKDAHNEIKKLKKRKEELLSKMKEKVIKPIQDKIDLFKKQIINAEKEIEKKKKDGTYSEPSPHLCLGYGNVKQTLSYGGVTAKEFNRVEPKVLFCDKRRNLGKIQHLILNGKY